MPGRCLSLLTRDVHFVPCSAGESDGGCPVKSGTLGRSPDVDRAEIACLIREKAPMKHTFDVDVHGLWSLVEDPQGRGFVAECPGKGRRRLDVDLLGLVPLARETEGFQGHGANREGPDEGILLGVDQGM